MLFSEDLGLHQPLVQPIHPGSYVHTSGIPLARPRFSLELWVQVYASTMPQYRHRPAALVSQCDDGTTACTFALTMDPEGRLELRLADRTVTTEARLLSILSSDSAPTDPGGAWRHIVATIGSKRATVSHAATVYGVSTRAPRHCACVLQIFVDGNEVLAANLAPSWAADATARAPSLRLGARSVARRRQPVRRSALL